MTTKTAFAAGILVVVASATNVAADDFSRASTYNAPYGMQAGQENQAASPSLRDADGNLAVVNGHFIHSGVASATGATAAGVFATGARSGRSVGTATAIGNQLSVVTLGNNNTVVVSATQTNSGEQTATNTIKGAN
jgi:holdfast attachment protein HfaA